MLRAASSLKYRCFLAHGQETSIPNSHEVVFDNHKPHRATWHKDSHFRNASFRPFFTERRGSNVPKFFSIRTRGVLYPSSLFPVTSWIFPDLDFFRSGVARWVSVSYTHLVVHRRTGDFRGKGMRDKGQGTSSRRETYANRHGGEEMEERTSTM